MGAPEKKPAPPVAAAEEAADPPKIPPAAELAEAAPPGPAAADPDAADAGPPNPKKELPGPPPVEIMVLLTPPFPRWVIP